jgi:lysophospholipase L1-like esterase
MRSTFAAKLKLLAESQRQRIGTVLGLVRKGKPVLTGKTAQTLLILVAVAAIPYADADLSHLRIVPAPTLGAILRGETAVESQSDSGADEELELIRAEQHSFVPGEIEDPTGHAMDHFFESLVGVEAGQRIARVCHYGDSPITNDGITSTVRRLLQLRFGDAGHGFVLIDRPWGWYGHQGVVHYANGKWGIGLITDRRGEPYGLGSVRFTTRGRASATFATAEDGEVGRSVSSFDVYFLAQPDGGGLVAELDSVHYGSVPTSSDRTRSGFYRVSVDRGAHRLTLRAAGDGPVTLFGVVLESADRGVVYDSLGFNGMFTTVLANYTDEEHWAEQLRHRNPDLIIIALGTNESQFDRLPMDQYELDTNELVRRLRTALPQVSIMFVGPMDRGTHRGGRVVTRPTIPRLVAYQRRLAAQTGCAFFDTFSAMGGAGTVAKWRQSRPTLMGGDLTHPTTEGAEQVGTLLHQAIIDAYEKYKGRRMQP